MRGGSKFNTGRSAFRFWLKLKGTVFQYTKVKVFLARNFCAQLNKG